MKGGSQRGVIISRPHALAKVFSVIVAPLPMGGLYNRVFFQPPAEALTPLPTNTVRPTATRVPRRNNLHAVRAMLPHILLLFACQGS